MITLSARVADNLVGVNIDLVAVMVFAMRVSPVEFTITEGVRSKARQRQLFDAGASKTMNSRHLTGHAVDVAAIVGGKVRWDFPLYDRIAVSVKEAAKYLGIPITWGGDWTTLRDGPHFELPWDDYPIGG